MTANGTNAYARIDSKFGNNSIQTPDIAGNIPPAHPGYEHIKDVSQNFKFRIHKYPILDNDVTREENEAMDRQRVEMRLLNGNQSNYGEIATYSWRFKLQSDFSVSDDFTHFFQIKGRGTSNTSYPLLTLSGEKSPDVMTMNYREENNNIIEILDSTPFAGVKNKWLNVYVRAKYGSAGSLEVSVHDDSGNIYLDYKSVGNKQMWRGGWTHTRPKWGIYRGLDHSSQLNDADYAWFDNLFIREGAEEAYGIRNLSTGNYIKETSGNSITSSGTINYNSSRWSIEAAPSSGYVLIRNLQTTTEYLRASTSSSVSSGLLVSEWSSMRWQLLPSPTPGYYYIKSKYFGTYLKNNGTSVVLSSLSSSNTAFRWKIE